MAIIAVALSLFAFSPAEKNNDVANLEIEDDAVTLVGCDQLYKTFEGFEECYTVTTIEEIEMAAVEIEVLDNL